MAERQRKHPLAEKIANAVFDVLGIAMIDELLSKAFNDACLDLDLAEQQSATIGTDRPAVEPAHDGTLAQGVKFQLLGATLCHPRAVLFWLHKLLVAQLLCQRRRPFSNPLVKYPG